MKWLIFEDALSDLHGHWFELIETFQKGFQGLGDEVQIFCSKDAMPSIIHNLGAKPYLPNSIWHRISDGSGPLKRLWRIPQHAVATFFAVRAVFGCQQSLPKSSEHLGKNNMKTVEPEVVFVPTVLPHHLLGWFPLVRKLTRNSKRTILFYFLSAPIVSKPNGVAVFERTPSAFLLKLLIWGLASFVKTGKVLLAAETKNLSRAMTKASGVPFTYLPQPVRAFTKTDLKDSSVHHPPLFLSFGPARWEKGSDILQSCISKYIADSDNTPVQFAMHWIENFRDPTGQLITKDGDLESSGKIIYITSYLQDEEYGRLLQSADAMIIPYRTVSYGLRGSHVLLEGLVAGIPCITTEGTAPAEDLLERGCGLLVKDGDMESLLSAINEMANNTEKFKNIAFLKKHAAEDYYSVKNFKKMFFANTFHKKIV